MAWGNKKKAGLADLLTAPSARFAIPAEATSSVLATPLFPLSSTVFSAEWVSYRTARIVAVPVFHVLFPLILIEAYSRIGFSRHMKP